MIELRGVSVSYNGHPVVSIPKLDVPNGEWLAIVGPNGAGKSSLLHAIAGRVVHRGSIRIDRHARSDHRQWARLVAWVPQRPVIPAGMTVLDYVLLGRYAHISHWGTEGRTDLELARQHLASVDLEGFENRLVGRLSGGEQQRVTVARALTQESATLLLDEPTASLDIGHQVAVLELVARLRAEGSLTVVSAMHDLTLAARFADRVMLLVGGEVVAVGAPTEILTSELLSEAYGTSVTVLRDDRGRPVVVPG